MRKFLITGAAALVLAVAGAATAAECSDVVPAGPTPVSSDTVRKDLESMGYRVVRIATEPDTYKVRAIDGETGIALKLRYDAATGELIRAQLHD